MKSAQKQNPQAYRPTASSFTSNGLIHGFHASDANDEHDDVHDLILKSIHGKKTNPQLILLNRHLSPFDP